MDKETISLLKYAAEHLYSSHEVQEYCDHLDQGVMAVGAMISLEPDFDELDDDHIAALAFKVSSKIYEAGRILGRKDGMTFILFQDGSILEHDEDGDCAYYLSYEEWAEPMEPEEIDWMLPLING